MLVACSECSHSVSEKAAACPKCGHPVPRDEAEARARVYDTVSILFFGAAITLLLVRVLYLLVRLTVPLDLLAWVLCCVVCFQRIQRAKRQPVVRGWRVRFASSLISLVAAVVLALALRSLELG